jgi:hypothetical protein
MGELFYPHIHFSEMKKLTNTFKLIHNNWHNTSETSYLDVEKFHTPHAVSLEIFFYAETKDSRTHLRAPRTCSHTPQNFF